MTGLHPYSPPKRPPVILILGALALLILGVMVGFSIGKNEGTISKIPLFANETVSPPISTQEESENTPGDIVSEDLLTTDENIETPPFPVETVSDETIQSPETTPMTEEAAPVQEDPLFHVPIVDDSLSFCPQSQDMADQLLENISPLEYIKKSPHKTYLTQWKDFFIKRNDVQLDYFEKHIRISKAEVVPPTATNGSYFHVEYYLIADWFSVPFTLDGFALQNADGNSLNKYQIKSLFAKSWGNPEKPTTFTDGKWTDYHYISDIHGNGSLLAKPISCNDVVFAFHTIDNAMKPAEMFQNQFSNELGINGQVAPLLDNNHNLIDPEQKCPHGVYNVIIEQLFDVVYDSPCAVP